MALNSLLCADVLLRNCSLTGCVILEIVKLVMNELYYNCLLPKFGDRLCLCFTDKDSFICHVESENLIDELQSISNEWLDMWNFRPYRQVFLQTNFSMLHKFIPTEFCRLRSKMYSLAMLDGMHDYCKAKGMPKTYIKIIRHEQYSTLAWWSTGKARCKFRTFCSWSHRILTRRL